MAGKIELVAPLDGVVTIEPEDTASNFTVTIPAVTAELLNNSSGILNIGSGQVYKDASGNLGIGTSTPATKLHINTDSGSAAVFVNSPSASDVGSYLSFRKNNSPTLLIGTDSALGGTSNDTAIFTYGANATRFYNNGAERARIDSAGNVGLGVTPSAWDAAIKAIQINNQGAVWSISSANPNVAVTSNARLVGATYSYVNTGVATQYAQSSGQHQFFTAPSGTAGNAISFTQAMTLDASGNLGVGTSTPGHRLEVVKSDPSSLGAIARFYHGPASDRSIEFGTSSISPFPLYIQGRASGSATNDMTLQPEGGNLLVGTTSNPNNTRLHVLASGGEGAITSQVPTTDTGYTHIFFRNPNGVVGQINTSASSTAYVTTSDYRLKENLVPIPDALTRVSAIPVYRFNFIADPDKTVDGFVAHELAAHVPEAVTGEKDAVETVEIKDDEGNVTGTEQRPVYQGVDQSKVVPLLTAAIQELKAELDTVKTELNTLKGN